MRHTHRHNTVRSDIRQTAWEEQAECNNEAFNKGMTSAVANFVGRGTQPKIEFRPQTCPSNPAMSRKMMTPLRR